MPDKSGASYKGVTVTVGEGRGTDVVTWACGKHLPLSHLSHLSQLHNSLVPKLRWAEMGLQEGLGNFFFFFAGLLFLTVVTQSPALAPRK